MERNSKGKTFFFTLPQIIYDILQELKYEACKTLPTTAYLVNFSDITMNAFSVIQKDELMSKIFHILLSIAPFRVLKIPDVQILRYMGFQKAVDGMAVGIPLEAQPGVANNFAPSKSSLDSSLSAVASAGGSDSSIRAFPKCMNCFPLFFHRQYYRHLNLYEDFTVDSLVCHGLCQLSR